MTSQRATDTNQELRNIPAKVRYEKTRHIEMRDGGPLHCQPADSIQAQNNRTIDGETGTPKWFFHRGSRKELVLHEGENIEFLTQLTSEVLIDRILGSRV